MSRTMRLALAVIPFAFTVACTDAAKAPAEAALKAAEAAVAELKGDAAKFAPDQVKAIQDALAAAKDKAAKEDFKGALAAAQEIPARTKEAVAAATAKKDALVKSWNELAGSLPNMVSALKSRLDILSQAKKLPAGITKATVEAGKEGLAAIQDGWTKVSDQFKSGDMAAAIAKATELKAKGAEIMKSIGMQQP